MQTEIDTLRGELMNLCIYHGGCPDGFTSAWIVDQWERNLSISPSEFHPGRYGENPPYRPGANVLIVDFSYPRDILLDMCEWANHVTVLDHHASAQRDLEGVEHPKLKVVFDMQRSGARITWDYIEGHKPPDLVRFVEDRDLWRHALDGTEEYIANLKSYPYTFEAWDLVARTPSAEIIAEGSAILRSNRTTIKRIIATSTRHMTIGGYEGIPVVNCPYDFGSDAAGEIATNWVPSLFAAYYLDRQDGRQFGLRSSDTGLDVSLIAGQYGGGGHPHAAGFTVPWGHEDMVGPFTFTQPGDPQ